jgi:type II secretory pathway pseudopilin PulG
MDQLLITIVLIGVLGAGVGYAVSGAKTAAEEKLKADTETKITSMLQQVGNTEAVQKDPNEAAGAAALCGSGYYVDVNENGSYDAVGDILIQASLPPRVASVTGTLATGITVTLN